MPIFISHSFEDQEQFDNIADALDREQLPYWKPSEIVAGAVLSDQLQDAIRRSHVCVFIATKNSVNSSWCNAELGAFWGAGKPVLIFVADASLKAEKLPKQFNGHYFEKRIARLVQACKDALPESNSGDNPAQRDSAVEPPGQLSAEDLVTLVTSAIERVTVRATAQAAFSQFNATIQSFASEVAPIDLNDASTRKGIQADLYQFLGLSKFLIQDIARSEWPYRVGIRTTTGRWEGFAQDEVNRNEDFLSRPCLLFRYDDNARVTASAFTPEIGDYNLYGMQARHPVVATGRGQFGTVDGNGYL